MTSRNGTKDKLKSHPLFIGNILGQQKVSSFWSQTRALAFLIFFFFAMKRCPIAATIAGSIGILLRCVLNNFFT